MVILREQRNVTKGIEKFDVGKVSQRIFEKWNADIGIAVDIGTTTIAMTVLDFRKKEILGQLSETNEQTRLGADVMMRIMHAVSGKADELHQMIVCQIEQMAAQVLNETLSTDGEVKNIQVCFSIVGNTTMCHLFLNKSVEKLAGYPFEPAYQGNYECIGSEIGMKQFETAKIHVLSGVAAHVGSDAVAVIGAEQIYKNDKVQLAIDLGTNAEIVLNNRGIVRVCSAAAGPAFEGKGIHCGMPARPGAITGIKFSGGNGNIILEYIAGDAVKGICGSGLVDLLAELRRCRLLKEDGYLLNREEALLQNAQSKLCSLLVEREEEHAFLLYSDTESGKEIYILQSDIRGAQLAKGAIQTGILALLEEAELKFSEVDEIYVSGVLGSCIRQSNAIAIGLLPSVNTEIHFVGNAAGKGAVLMFLQEQFEEKMEALTKEICHVELVNLPEFQKLFLQSMNLSRWK